MKLKSKTYAMLLAELMQDNKIDKKTIDRFMKLLEKNKDVKGIKEIVYLAEEIYFQKLGKRKITLETARKINSEKMAKGFLKNSDIINEVVKEDLVAGMRIIVNDEKQLDFSLKKILEETFKRA